MPITPVRVHSPFVSGTMSQRRGSSGVFALRLDPAEIAKVTKKVEDMRAWFELIVAGVRPEYGAYMPYSMFQEVGIPGSEPPFPFTPHIEPSIMRNATFIRQGLQRGLSQLILRYSRTDFPVLKSARKEVSKVWEGVLNAKPRIDAMKNAPVEYGFHRSTIRGYGDARTAMEIRKQQQELMRQRALVEDRLSHSADSPAGREGRNIYRRYAKYRKA